LPILQWPLSYNNICLNAAPIILNPSIIQVFVNNAWVSVTSIGGPGYFSGNGVFGNSFFPNTLGPHVITYTYTGVNGCTNTITNTINVVRCGIIIDVTVILEGYYLGAGLMNDNYTTGGLLHSLGYSSNYNDVDTVEISVMEPVAPYNLVESKKGIVHLDGTVSVTYGPSVLDGHYYYLKFNHRNSLETWSANPVLFTAPSTSYNFTTSQGQAYGNNMVETFDQMGWAIFSGDISHYLTGLGYQDGVIESQDYGDMENAVYVTLIGYKTEDITGDGIVESNDYGVMETNVYYSRVLVRP
jgi:hypothetical protein